MKNIKSYVADKYASDRYKLIEEGIYETKDEEESLFVTSLSFEQEPEYGEGENAVDISQYPVEDILDKFYCHISDFYKDLNEASSTICYQEFASPDIEDVRGLRSIIGKHVYNRDEERDGKVYAMLEIE